jgi:hypothetical protein
MCSISQKPHRLALRWRRIGCSLRLHDVRPIYLPTGLIAALALFGGGILQANPITYTFTTTATGTFAGTSFTNAAITVTSSADTNGVVSYLSGTEIFDHFPGSTTLNIAGFAPAIFTDPTFWEDPNQATSSSASSTRPPALRSARTVTPSWGLRHSSRASNPITSKAPSGGCSRQPISSQAFSTPSRMFPPTKAISASWR